MLENIKNLEAQSPLLSPLLSPFKSLKLGPLNCNIIKLATLIPRRTIVKPTLVCPFTVVKARVGSL